MVVALMSAAGCVDVEYGEIGRVVGHTKSLSSAGDPETVGAQLSSYNMYWKKRSAQSIVKRIEALAEIFMQKKSQSAQVSPYGRTQRPFADMPELVVKNVPDYDEIRMMNTAVLSQRDVGNPDMGEVAAKAKMQQVFNELVQASLIDAKGYDLASAGVGYLRELLGDQKVVVYRRVNTYGFKLMRNVNGIPVANAGLLIGIHARTGALTYLRIGGVTIDSQWNGTKELPAGGGATIARQVSTAALKSRFSADVSYCPRTVLSERLMYIMPNGVQSAVVEPRYVIRFSRRTGKLAQPAERWAYSVTNPNATLEVMH